MRTRDHTLEPLHTLVGLRPSVTGVLLTYCCCGPHVDVPNSLLPQPYVSAMEPPHRKSRTLSCELRRIYSQLMTVKSVQIAGSGDALLLLNVKTDVTVRKLALLWAQYLETLDDNAAIDVTRIR